MILIVNAEIVTGDKQNPFISGGAIAIEGTKIVKVGSTSGMKPNYPDAELFDAQGGMLTPGHVNAHMHLYSSLARGMPPPEETPKNFVEILEKVWWRLDTALTSEDVYLSAMVGLMESAKAGVTTVIDHHSSPNAITGSLSTISKAVRETGLRGILCYEVSDRDGAEKRDEGIKENADFINSNLSESDDSAGLFGLHASFTLSDESLDASLEANGDKGFHIHVAEDRADLDDARQKYNMSTVERLTAKGILNEKSIAAHCVHLEDGDVGLLKDSGVMVTHQPLSNANNAVGRAEIPNLLKEKVRVALGTDSYTHNMLEEAHFALLNHDAENGGPLSVSDVTLMLSENACAASGYLGVKLGLIAEGYEADFAIYDYSPPTPVSKTNINSHIFYGLRSILPKSVFAKGEKIVDDYKMTKVNEEEIYEKSRRAAKALWDRI
ncbi:MAG: putative aminohydrolase SsnA [Candidatus Marinimicrobia bacterium]|nr:putative aminohydrolase SsnA [Candidatus Neomarinimicrobiota bacterium]